MARRRRRSRNRIQKAQALALYLGGFAGVAYEVVTQAPDKPALYFLLGGMLGLPQFIGSDPPSPPDDGSDPSASSNGHRPPDPPPGR